MGELDYANRFVNAQNFKMFLDQYSDFCKKLRFFSKGAFTIQEETLALEIISEFLDQKEKELNELTDRFSSQTSTELAESEPVEILLGRFLMQNEDYQMLQQIAEIRKTGGTRWERLQSIIQDTFSASPKDR
ncbi:MAG: hypothetical protein ABSF90_22760 [Syntrophobacteraceae bacterium]